MNGRKHITLKLFSRFLAGKANQEEKGVIKSHFEMCSACKKAAQDFSRKVLSEIGGVKGVLIDIITDPSHLEEKTTECLDEWEMDDFIAGKQTRLGAEHIFTCPYCTSLYFLILQAQERVEEIESHERYAKIPEPIVLSLITRFVQKAKGVAEIVLAEIDNNIRLLKQISTDQLALERLYEAGAEGKSFKGKVTLFNKVIMVYEWKKIEDKWDLEIRFSNISPLSGIQVKLISPVQEVASATTDDKGELKFKHIPNGNYHLQIVPPNNKSVEIKVSLEMPETPPEKTLEGLLQLADEFVENNDLSRAIQCLERARTLFPKDMGILIKLASLALINGLTDDAERYLKDADPDDNNVKFLKGELACSKRNYDEALKYYKEFSTAEKDPHKRVRGYMGMIRCYGAQNKPKEVIKTFETAAKYGVRNAHLDAFTVVTLKQLIGKRKSAHFLLEIIDSLPKENLGVLAEVFQGLECLDEVNLIKAKIATLEKRIVETHK